MRDAIYKNFKGILLSLAVGPRQKYVMDDFVL